jgi:hypothetical protein
VSIQRKVTPGGKVRYRARIKANGREVASRMFDRKSDAVAWEHPRLAETRVRRDSSTSRTVYGVLCEGDTADGEKELTVTPQAFIGSTRSSAMGRIIAVVADKTRTHGS